MQTVITDVDNIKHKVIAHKIDKYLFVLTKCGKTVAMISPPCPKTEGHLIALPQCTKHSKPILCGRC